jgi:TRAP-type C4-dicarboxylate transport system permease small subunit
MPVLLAAIGLAALYVVMFAIGGNEDLRDPLLGIDGLLLIHAAMTVFVVIVLIRPVASIAAHAALNTAIHRVGQTIAIIALAVMVGFILLQVYFRYVQGDALNWTEEAARFGMLWMTGLMAPIAYRKGGFVAIDMLERAIAPRAAALLTLLLMGISLWVLLICFDRGWNNHVDSLSGRGASASLRLPLDWFGGERMKFRNNWQYASIFVGVMLMIVVSVELLLRQIVTLMGRGDTLPPISHEEFVGAD